MFKKFWDYIVTSTLYQHTHNWHSNIIDYMGIPSSSTRCALAPYFNRVREIE